MAFGFVLFWPLGVMILAYLMWSGRLMCCIGMFGPRRRHDSRRCDVFSGESRSTGNAAFDDYREATLRRLEEERREFTQFLERLRRAKDQEEFDSFMAERSAPPSTQ
jgi:hypothetical protein